MHIIRQYILLSIDQLPQICSDHKKKLLDNEPILSNRFRLDYPQIAPIYNCSIYSVTLDTLIKIDFKGGNNTIIANCISLNWFVVLIKENICSIKNKHYSVASYEMRHNVRKSHDLFLIDLLITYCRHRFGPVMAACVPHFFLLYI